MNKQRLFEYIRGEEVVIWAGAGFSKYAGYPLGGELRDLLFQHLSDEERLLVDGQAYLDVFSEEFVRLKDGGRSELNELLKAFFLKPPVDTSAHDLLAKIPHIKNIITTNYDELFELAYKQDHCRLVVDQDIVKIERSKVNVIKFHGDLSVPSSIILTKEDYARFYNEDKAAPLRALVTQLIATKVVLFIGYGYEDPNVWALFNHLVGFVREKRKDAYCIAPGLPDHKVRYLNRNGITYIDDTAGNFLQELYEDIRSHIFADFPQKRISSDTFREFLNQHNLNPGLSGDASGFRITSLKGLHSPPKGKLSFSPNPGSDIAKRYGEFMEKGFVNALELGEEQVSGLKLHLEGLDLYPGVDLSKIVLRKQPQQIFDYDLVFSAAGFEISSLKAEFYRGSHQATIKTTIHNLLLEFTATRQAGDKVHLSCKLTDSYRFKNISTALEAYRFMELFYNGEVFTVFFTQGGHEGFSKNLDAAIPQRVDIANNFIVYLNKLRKVEQAFSMRFTDIIFSSGDEEAILDRLLSVIDNQSIRVYTPDISLKMEEIYPETLVSLRELNQGSHNIDINWSTMEEFCLHGFKFYARRLQLEIPSATVANLVDLEAGKVKDIKLISRSGYILEHYTLAEMSYEKLNDQHESESAQIFPPGEDF